MKKCDVKQVTFEEYNKQIDKISKKKLPVHEALIEMLDYAATVRIEGEDSQNIAPWELGREIKNKKLTKVGKSKKKKRI